MQVEAFLLFPEKADSCNALLLQPQGPVLQKGPLAHQTCGCVFIHHLADDADGLRDLQREAIRVLQILHQHLLLHQCILSPGCLRICRAGLVFAVGLSWAHVLCRPLGILLLCGSCWA